MPKCNILDKIVREMDDTDPNQSNINPKQSIQKHTKNKYNQNSKRNLDSDNSLTYRNEESKSTENRLDDKT